ncbi:hypothetical protein H4R33_003250 [Dimargaris cristalligena]|nr:hypothetical protein H4R33_003250 [Dimargaris cristalligena]
MSLDPTHPRYPKQYEGQIRYPCLVQRTGPIEEVYFRCERKRLRFQAHKRARDRRVARRLANLGDEHLGPADTTKICILSSDLPPIPPFTRKRTAEEEAGLVIKVLKSERVVDVKGEAEAEAEDGDGEEDADDDNAIIVKEEMEIPLVLSQTQQQPMLPLSPSALSADEDRDGSAAVPPRGVAGSGLPPPRLGDLHQPYTTSKFIGGTFDQPTFRILFPEQGKDTSPWDTKYGHLLNQRPALPEDNPTKGGSGPPTTTTTPLPDLDLPSYDLIHHLHGTASIYTQLHGMQRLQGSLTPSSMVCFAIMIQEYARHLLKHDTHPKPPQ